MSIDVERVASLVAQRNAVDAEIGAITGRPVVAGHLGEWIASRIFDIALEDSATSKAMDGRFVSGPLTGRTVNVKWYGKREGLLDITTDPALAYYLVLAGPKAPAASSGGSHRPLTIASVHLFDAHRIHEQLRSRGVRIGVASSVTVDLWEAAELFPRQANAELPVSDDQRRLLGLFARKPL